MKFFKVSFCLLALSAGAAMTVRAQTNASYTYNVNATVPDGSAVGLASVGNVSGVIGYITNVQVSLNLTGGFNGDLYAYLAGPSGGFTVLLNRSGVTNGNAFGYSDAGFNITLNDGAADIHKYQDGSYTITGGQLVNTWSPDGRNVDPQSAGSVFDAAARTSDLEVYNNYYLPNGDWTLFIADLAGGSQSTLVSWGLTIVTVPEPQTWALALAGGIGLLVAFNRRRR